MMTRNFADVIRAKMAADPELAEDITTARAEDLRELSADLMAAVALLRDPEPDHHDMRPTKIDGKDFLIVSECADGCRKCSWRNRKNTLLEKYP